MALQNDGENWWKVVPQYSNEVLIRNWLEERKRLKDTGKLCSSILGTDFICFGDHTPGETLRITREKLEGLPMQHLFAHHNEPRSHNLVSEYDDKYNRHGYNSLLPPFRTWNGHKLSWIPQKSDFPIREPPTNYGLLEYLMKKWHEEDAEVMKSVYTISYERPPISALATCPRQPAKAQDLLSNQGHLQNMSQILGYEGAQKYLQAVRQLVRDRRPWEASV